MEGGPEGVWISADRAKRGNLLVTTRSPPPPRRALAALHRPGCVSLSAAPREAVCLGCDGLPLQASRALSIGRSLRPTWWRVLEVLLASIGRHVKQATDIRECFGAARVSRVGVEHIVAEAEEYAKAMLFTLRGTGSVPCFQLSLGLIIVFDGRHLLIVRHVKVIVEITAKRGKPRQAPTHFRLVGFQLGVRSARHEHESRVALV